MENEKAPGEAARGGDLGLRGQNRREPDESYDWIGSPRRTGTADSPTSGRWATRPEIDRGVSVEDSSTVGSAWETTQVSASGRQEQPPAHPQREHGRLVSQRQEPAIAGYP